MAILKESDANVVLDRTINLHELDRSALVALYGETAQTMLDKLPENAEMLMVAVGVPAGAGERLHESLRTLRAFAERIQRPVQQEQLERLVDTLLPPMAPPRHVVLEAEMLANAKSRILSSQDWVTAKDIAKLGQFSPSNASAQPNNWKRAGRIFAINHKNTDYFPLYGLEIKSIRPLPAMKQVLDVLMPRDPWEIAFWFDACNSYLDGRRPQDVIGSEPDKVVEAAGKEANWEANG